MQTLQQAIKRAKQLSKGNYPETCFVVFSKDENDIPDNDYHPAFESDLDTFYLGCEVLYCSDED